MRHYWSRNVFRFLVWCFHHYICDSSKVISMVPIYLLFLTKTHPKMAAKFFASLVNFSSSQYCWSCCHYLSERKSSSCSRIESTIKVSQMIILTPILAPRMIDYRLMWRSSSILLLGVLHSFGINICMCRSAVFCVVMMCDWEIFSCCVVGSVVLILFVFYGLCWNLSYFFIIFHNS